VLVWLFLRRQRTLAASGRPALLDVTMFTIPQLRSGLSVLGAQYAVLAGLFFMIPVYLQMTLGMDALATGIRIFPLSIGLILFSIVGTVFTRFWSPRRIVRIGQLVLVVSSLLLLSSVYPDLRGAVFAIGMFFAGSGLGLLASQLGNVNMSSVDESRSSEAGGLQGVFQNLGSSLGTALIGSILIATLGSTFTVAVGESNLSAETKSAVLQATEYGVAIMPTAGIPEVAAEAGLPPAEGTELQRIYSESQLDALRTSLFALAVIAALALFFSRNIPNEVLGKRKESSAGPDPKPDPAATAG
jgi:predicted MFS family arabinose efflux permease